jgi:hypothetical protein
VSRITKAANASSVPSGTVNESVRLSAPRPMADVEEGAAPLLALTERRRRGERGGRVIGHHAHGRRVGVDLDDRRPDEPRHSSIRSDSDPAPRLRR